MSLSVLLSAIGATLSAMGMLGLGKADINTCYVGLLLCGMACICQELSALRARK